MSWNERWEALSPGLRRGLVLAGGALAIIGIAVVLVGGSEEEKATPTERQRLVQNLLTDADPRAMGIEGPAARLRRLETHIDQVTTTLDKLGVVGDPDPERDALIEGVRKEHARQLDALRDEQAALREQLETIGRTSGDPPPAESRGHRSKEPVRRERPAEVPLAQLFDEPPPPTAARATAAKPLQIRVVGPEQTEGEGAVGDTEDAVLIPAGSILRAVFLSGMDAPTGRAARRDPYPALARIKHDAILPNRFRADVRECFLVLAGYGDLASERAYLRTESIACVREDGGAIEVAVDGYPVGEDGKAGVRGRLVNKQGQIIAKAMQVAFLEGFSKLFSTVPVATISTTAGATPFQSVTSPEALQGAAVGGAGKALDRLANYFLDMAEDMFPVIEIDAGRSVEFILNRGVSLRLGEGSR
jgi:conjugal transfer pilus assembly protein TraB